MEWPSKIGMTDSFKNELNTYWRDMWYLKAQAYHFPIFIYLFIYLENAFKTAAPT